MSRELDGAGLFWGRIPAPTVGMRPAAANVDGIVIVHDPECSHMGEIGSSHVHSILEIEVGILNRGRGFLPVRNTSDLNNGSGPGLAGRDRDRGAVVPPDISSVFDQPGSSGIQTEFKTGPECPGRAVQRDVEGSRSQIAGIDAISVFQEPVVRNLMGGQSTFDDFAAVGQADLHLRVGLCLRLS